MSGAGEGAGGGHAGSDGAVSAGAGHQRCIAVEVGGGLYGLPVAEVQEVVALGALTRVFHAPPAVAGVMGLRGEVLPVLVLSELLGLAVGRDDACVVVVREPGGLKRRAGLRVARLAGLREVPAAGLVPAPATLPGQQRRFVSGVIQAPPPCTVLSVELLLGAPELAALAAGP